MNKSSMKALFFYDFENSYIPQILEEIYIKQVYKPFLEGQKDLTIVDIGANIGLTSFYFKDFAKKVFSIEPSKQHTECIKALIEQNKIDNIELYPFAISNENGKTKFYHNDNVTMFSMEDTVNKKNDFEEIETLTLDNFMKRAQIDKIDLLKLDVEGSEGKVITSEGFRKVADKIKVIVGEWHNWCPMSKDVFMNEFRDQGFEFKWLTNTQASVFTAVRV